MAERQKDRNCHSWHKGRPVKMDGNLEGKNVKLYEKNEFLRELGGRVCELPAGDFCLTAIDIEHFRLFNKLYGRQVGDELIAYVKDCLAGEPGALAGYMGGDNFAILIPDEPDRIIRIREKILFGIHQWSNNAGFLPLFGIYALEDRTVLPEVMYDRATMALSKASEKGPDRICRYTSDMETRLEQELALLSQIQEGLENDEFTFYVQPQCNISNGTIVGAEALVRWEKKDGTIVTPGVFIPVLEKNCMIDRLDRRVWENVCSWLRGWIDRGYTPVPISINISRIDILSMDVPEYLRSLLSRYRIPEELIKVEITESAYTESNDRISSAVNELRDNGFKVMMDDFGCGYSSLNMLKNIPVDVLKLDMRFLYISDNTEEKGLNILESVINMARLLHLPVVVEGVENEIQERYVQNLGCRYTQGYYYYRPLPVGRFEELLSDGRRLDYHGLSCKQVEPLHIREFIDRNIISDSMLNQIMGPVAFYEMYGQHIEIVRVNEQYRCLIGSTAGSYSNYGDRFWNHIREDDRMLLYLLFQSAYSSPTEGAEGNIHMLRLDGSCMLVHIRIFFLKEKDGHRQYYSSLTDISAFFEPMDRKRPAEPFSQERSFLQQHKAFDAVPMGISILRVISNDGENAHDFEVIYANPYMCSFCGMDLKKLREVVVHLLFEKKAKVLEDLYCAAYLGKQSEICLYSRATKRYLEFTFFPYSEGYAGCIVQDATQLCMVTGTLNSMMSSYRAIYYVQLQDNYCRMLYPDQNSVQERGNYEEMIERHLYSGLVNNSDVKEISRFLRLEHLRHVFRQQDTVEMSYKRFQTDGTQEWCSNCITVSERNEAGVPQSAVMVIRSIDSMIRSTGDKKAVYLSELLAGMSEGFFIYRASKEEEILFANPGVLRMFGCASMEEFQALTGGSFRGMVHPADLERTECEICDQVQHSDRHMDYIQYRIIRKDGSVGWVDDCGHLEHDLSDTEGSLFYVFLSDITDTITEAQKNRLLVRNTYYQSNESEKHSFLY